MQAVRKFTFDVGWVLVSSAVTLVIGFVLRVVLAHWFGASDLGLYSMVITIQVIATLISDIGFVFAITKYVAEFKDRRDKLLQITSANFIGSIITGLVVGILLYLLSGILASLFHMPDLARLLKIIAPFLPFNSILQVEIGLFNGLRQMKTYALITVFQNSLMALLIITFVWLGFGVDGATWGIVLSVAGACILGLCFSWKFLYMNLHGAIEGMKRQMSFGIKVFIANALGLILSYTDSLMIGYFLSAKYLGYYSIAIAISTIFPIVPAAIQRISYPATSEYWAQDRHQSLGIMIDKSMKYSACILLPLGLLIGFFSKELITGVFGQQYISAMWPLRVLVIGAVIEGSTMVPIGGCFSGAGRPDIVMKLAAISVPVTVGLYVLFIPHWGILGAATANITSALIGAALFLALMRKILAIRIDAKWFIQAMGFTGVTIALFWVGTRFINPYIVGSVILCGYIVTVYRIFLTREDRTILKSLAKSLVQLLPLRR